MSPEEIWQTVRGEMELSISKANFTTWFRGTRIIEQDDKNITIGVPNNFIKEWFQKKYNTQIFQIIQKSLPELKKIEYRVSTSNKIYPAVSASSSSEESAPPSNDSSPTSQTSQLSSFDSQHSSAQSTFNQKFTFDTFIVGNNNRLAHATSMSICKKPGEIHNPLFIYGGVGLGKTHLIHAIGNEIQKQFPDKKVLYVSCENFTNEFIHSISTRKINDFKKKYRNVDVLLVDDIQFLSHKEGTQEEFFHTFNALHQTNRQIVITSDRVHTSIPDLEARLSSRFGGGMVADVRPPNLETRLAILQTKCEEKNFVLEPELLTAVGEQITTNIRELEGALNRIITHCTLYKTEPSLDIINELLEDVAQNKSNKKVSPDQILKAIIKYFNITLEELTGKCRTKDLVYPRQLAMYLFKQELNMSFPMIGRELGGKDHTTIIHGVKKIKREVSIQKSIQHDLIGIKEIVYG